MSGLILTTAVVPFGLGIVAGLLAWLVRGRPLALWMVLVLCIVAIFILLEGIPPFPPIASKQRLGYAILLACTLAPALRFGPSVLAVLCSVLLVAADIWIAWTKLTTAPSQALAWLLPLPIVIAIGVAMHRRERRPDDNFYASRLGLLGAGIAGAIAAIVGGFVGLGQLQGAFAALIGGTLVVAYGVLLARPGDSRLVPFSSSAEIAAALALAAMMLISAAFTPTPNPGALWAAALAYLAPAFVPVPASLKGALRPFVPGLAAAIPAVAAVAIALFVKP